MERGLDGSSGPARRVWIFNARRPGSGLVGLVGSESRVRRSFRFVSFRCFGWCVFTTNVARYGSRRVASISKRRGASRRQSFGLVFEESLDVEGREHHDGAAPLLPGERMEEEETREEDGEELTRRHDGGEEERSKLFDGVQNAELTAHRGQRQDEDVLEYGGVATDEVEGLGKGTVGEEPEEREGGGDAVDVEHLVVRLHLITLEELVLESRGETVKSKVAKHEEHALRARARASSAMLVRHLSVQSENGTPERNAQRYEVIARLVSSLIDKVSPNHHRDHLCALTQSLYRE